MASFNITGGSSTTFVDTSPNGGFVIDFTSLDNSFDLQINGVNLFVGGPAGAPNELQFQIPSTFGQTVRFADGDRYELNTPAVWQLGNSDPDAPVVRLVVNPDGTIELYGIKTNNGPLEPLELFNGLTVNSAAVAAAWNDTGTNTITLGQSVTGPTNAGGDFEDVLCFGAGTLIETSEGAVPVEDLQAGDHVLTHDHGLKPLRWVGSRRLSNTELTIEPRLRPIRISANALGAGHPKQDLIVSQQHRILVSSVVAQRMFDCPDVLIPAKKLLSLDGIEIVTDTPNGVEFYHLLFDSHELVWSNGALTESLYTGPEALKSVSAEAQQEIQDLFPECCDPQFEALSVRYIPKKGKQMRKLVDRHQANKKPLYSRSATVSPNPA
ncbi:Hint domain-containing protein [Ruegeria sp. R14_0]|uniref:Hint domain-containing protein n=1 Tax=Ruegeria sp. R14_0 TaxID=2821100 RepID=UPI001AD9A48F|nr:Hint domain-containing protein [Ruegeria sp. R14_0]MBO9448587.1 Hint domain-containing protein [Ruegeria sp. R14_0]